MKVGIIGAGAVARACLLATVVRGAATDIVVVDRTRERAEGLVIDVGYGAMLSPAVTLRAGDYAELAGADLVMLTSGVNEKDGGATDRADPEGRLRLLAKNAEIFHDIVPRIAASAPDTMLLVVTDPPDALADVARTAAPDLRIVSAGTFLDSLRFRLHVARKLDVHPRSVDAVVLGEHGTSSVFLWSAARVGATPVLDALEGGASARDAIEKEVREANIQIIEGIGASQFGIGMVCARLAEIMARDEKAVVPLGCYQADYGVTLSLPAVLGRRGVLRILRPPMTPDEAAALQRSADHIRNALRKVAGQ
jgi:L-lactate dehydrogenase